MASGNNMKAHEATYGSFLDMLKIATPVLAVLTAVVIAVIS
jgi:hypothetical protein